MKHERKTKDEYLVEEKVAGRWTVIATEEKPLELAQRLTRLRGQGRNVRWKRRMVPR